jgi:hypothetical protein
MEHSGTLPGALLRSRDMLMSLVHARLAPG